MQLHIPVLAFEYQMIQIVFLIERLRTFNYKRIQTTLIDYSYALHGDMTIFACEFSITCKRQTPNSKWLTST